MYAVIETGGKQYRVEVGTELQVELLDVEPGKTITLERVLLVADGDEAAIGRPLVANAEVSAEVVRQMRGEKIDQLQVPTEGAQPRQEGSSPGADGPAHQRHHLRRSAAPRRTRPRPSRDAKTERQRLEEAAAAQAAKDAELAAKLAVGAEAAAKKATPKKTTAKAEATDSEAKADAKAPKKTTAKAGAAKTDARPTREGRRQGHEADDRQAGRQEGRRQAGRSEAAARHEEGRVDEMAHKKAGGSSRTAATASASDSASRPATASSSPPARSSSASAA